jgi:hypothetical protein
LRIKMAGLAALALLGTFSWSSRTMAVEQDDFKLQTAQNLANLCGVLQYDPLYDEGRQFCYGYIAGAGQFYLSMLHGGAVQPIACPKTEPSRDEMATIFVAWLTTHPQHTTEAPLDALMRAAAGAWPCGK